MEKKENKLQTFLSKWGLIIIIGLLLISTYKSCDTNKDLSKLRKEVKLLEKSVDSLADISLDETEMKEVIKRTPAWESLRIEEISDKEKISINAIKAKND